MGVCLSAPKATESGPPVTSARTFGVTPVKTAPSTRARGDGLVDVQLDTPKEAPPPRSQPTDDDATRHPSAGFGSFLQAKVTTPPESSPSNAIDRELVDAMADAVVSATRRLSGTVAFSIGTARSLVPRSSGRTLSDCISDEQRYGG